MKKTVVAGLDLVRFFAACIVALFHVAFCAWAFPDTDSFRASGGVPRFPELTPLASVGSIGVQIFFVLSGFVIVFSARGTAYDFFRSRVLRLVPGAIICATITGALLLLRRFVGFPEVVWLWLHSVSFLNFTSFVDSVYWTLPIEVSFYTLVLITLTIGGASRLELMIESFLLVHILNRVMRVAAGMGIVPEVLGPPSRFLTEFQLLDFGPYFALGSVLYFITEKGLRLRLLVSFCAALALCALPMAREALDGSPAKLIIWLGALIAMIISIVANDRISAMVSPRLTRRLGIATYPLYLLHNVIGSSLIGWLAGLGVNRWGAFLITMAAVFALAVAVSEGAEPQLRRLFNYVLPRRAAPKDRSQATPQ